LMKRTLELGEQYQDRTYQVLKEAAEKTGALTFPHVPQRAIEIAYMSTKGIYALPILENSSKRLAFRIAGCSTYSLLVHECGRQVAETLPCRYACLAACHTVCQELGIDTDVVMEASAPKDGSCQFALNKRTR